MMLPSPAELVVVKTSLSRWEIFEDASTAVVIVGVVGEYIANYTKFAEQGNIEKRLGRIFTAVLIVGLACELLGLVRTQQLSGQIIASLEEEAAQATNQAESARATTKPLEAQIAEANSRAKNAEAQYTSANARIAEANAKAAEANQKAEQERLARIKIEERMTPRGLHAEQEDRIVAKLSVFKGYQADFAVTGQTWEQVCS